MTSHDQERKMSMDYRHAAASRKVVATRIERPLGTVVAL